MRMKGNPKIMIQKKEYLKKMPQNRKNQIYHRHLEDNLYVLFNNPKYKNKTQQLKFRTYLRDLTNLENR